jgi:hypothetical protein
MTPTNATVMNTGTFDRKSLGVAATLLLAGQLLYVVITLFHTGGEANNHSTIFAAYAASQIWTGVHVAQFTCMAIMLAGLLALFFALDVPTGTAGWAARCGAASAVATLALCGVVLAVDGVALKQAANAWASAPEAEKTARFAVAEGMRWLEWGTRSFESFTLGLAVLLFAPAVARTARVPRPIAYLMALAGLAYLVQGWTGATEGFSQTHTTGIVLAEVFNAAWAVWLLVVAQRIPELEPASLGRNIGIR